MDPLQAVLGVLTVFTGGAMAQLLVFLLRRRAEIKDLDAKAALSLATADSSLLDSATAYAAQLQATVTGQATMAEKLTARIDHLEKALDEEQERSRRNAEIAHAEIGRLSAVVAQLRTDLTIANGQVERMQAEIAARGRHGL